MSDRKRGRRGRPPLPEDQRRSVVVPLKLTPAEADELYRRVARERTTLAALVRAALFPVNP